MSCRSLGSRDDLVGLRCTFDSDSSNGSINFSISHDFKDFFLYHDNTILSGSHFQLPNEGIHVI